MDEQKNNQDLTVGLDGVMNEGDNNVLVEQAVENISPSTAPPSAAEIQEPTINTVAPPPQDETVKLPEESTPTIAASDSFSGGGVVEAPDDMQMVSAPEIKAAQTTETSTDLLTTPGSATSSETIPQSQQSINSSNQQRPHEHRNNKKLAIIVTVLVAVILSVIAIFVYLSTEDNTSPAPLSAPIESTLPDNESFDTTPVTDPSNTNDLPSDSEQPIEDTETPLSEPGVGETEDTPVSNDPIPQESQ